MINGQNTDIIRIVKGMRANIILTIYNNNIKIQLSWENSSVDPLFFLLHITDIFLHNIL